jgi:NDP-sugar pyrophosphorylase family protein
MTLVILAAGMGSRYGGLKQIDPITNEGEFIIDFSVYDAIQAGFDKVVFVIKRENLELFRETVGTRFESRIKVEYAFQELTDIPDGYSVPEGRVKPWGTAHALLAARELVTDPFMVINSDDFYGRSAYRMLADHFKNGGAGYAMVGYILENTLTENGTVSRGICSVDENNMLLSVEERTEIRREGDKAAYKNAEDTAYMPLRSVASMNCWGFTPDIFERLWQGFETFLSEKHADGLKCEYYLPFAVCDMLNKGECSVRVYSSEDSWYGVTYKEDKPFVVSSIAALKNNGAYPEKLNG